MSVKKTAKTAKTANISASIYESDFNLDFDCVGVETCRYALCSIMPPDGSEECAYRDHGSCGSPPAQCAAIEALRNKLAKELKEREGDNE